jgi:hypothetical protein
MKSSVKTLFVVLAIVMSFVAVQAIWALDCSKSVTGEITNDPSVDRGIEVTDEDGAVTTVYGIPDYLQLKAGEVVTITYGVQPGGDFVACSLQVGTSLTILRPRAPEQPVVPSATAAAGTECTCDNCHCVCPEDCDDCTCECSCDCTCDGEGDGNQHKGTN